jgi:hypothetical protein
MSILSQVHKRVSSSASQSNMTHSRVAATVMRVTNSLSIRRHEPKLRGCIDLEWSGLGAEMTWNTFWSSFPLSLYRRKWSFVVLRRHQGELRSRGDAVVGRRRGKQVRSQEDMELHAMLEQWEANVRTSSATQPPNSADRSFSPSIEDVLTTHLLRTPRLCTPDIQPKLSPACSIAQRERRLIWQEIENLTTRQAQTHLCKRKTK